MKFNQKIQAQSVHLNKAVLPLKLSGTSRRKLSVLVLVIHTCSSLEATSVLKNEFPHFLGKACSCAELDLITPLLHVDLLFQKHISWGTKEQVLSSGARLLAHNNFPWAFHLTRKQNVQTCLAITAAPLHRLSNAWEKAIYQVKGRVEPIAKKPCSHIRPDEMPAVMLHSLQARSNFKFTSHLCILPAQYSS